MTSVLHAKRFRTKFCDLNYAIAVSNKISSV